MNIDNFDFAHEGANDDAPMFVNYLVTRLQPALQAEVTQQLCTYGISLPLQEERELRRPLEETPKRRLSPIREEESKEQESNETLSSSKDVAPE
ncbi:hypothetical protein, partial [Enterobacter cloacae complex sp. GF14B]|uniref:hypothetical protein n=1 Tax=Enterobacter cloacae complex sp. GF14B TaxID=2511982 RepID=UPI00111324B2